MALEPKVMSNDEAWKTSSEPGALAGAITELGRNNWIVIPASTLKHAHTGRVVGPNFNYWYDYCNSINDGICFSDPIPFIAGRYRFLFSINFKVPKCLGSNTNEIFTIYTANTPTHNEKSLTWQDLVNGADSENIYSGQIESTFILPSDARVIFGITAKQNTIGIFPVELLVKNLSIFND